MTLITYHESDGSRSRPSLFTALVRAASLTVAKLRDAWLRRQTEKMLEGLDPDIRKDIGWPTSNAARNQ